MRLMRFRHDVQVTGRYFPKGTVLRFMVQENSAILPPSIESQNTICRVPLAALEPVMAFDATVFNARFGVEVQCEIMGIDAEDACSRFRDAAADCEVLRLVKLEE